MTKYVFSFKKCNHMHFKVDPRFCKQMCYAEFFARTPLQKARMHFNYVMISMKRWKKYRGWPVEINILPIANLFLFLRKCWLKIFKVTPNVFFNVYLLFDIVLLYPTFKIVCENQIMWNMQMTLFWTKCVFQLDNFSRRPRNLNLIPSWISSREPIMLHASCLILFFFLYIT